MVTSILEERQALTRRYAKGEDIEFPKVDPSELDSRVLIEAMDGIYFFGRVWRRTIENGHRAFVKEYAKDYIYRFNPKRIER